MPLPANWDSALYIRAYKDAQSMTTRGLIIASYLRVVLRPEVTRAYRAALHFRATLLRVKMR